MTKILKFSAAWCQPCKVLSKTIEGQDLGAPVEEVDIDANMDQAVQYGVRGVPTLVLVDESGKALRSLVGAQTLAAVKNWVKG